jgi:hypothetical protein
LQESVLRVSAYVVSLGGHPKLLERLLSHRLRVVEASPKTNRSRNDDGASQKDTHVSVPRFFVRPSNSDYTQFAAESCDTFDTLALNRARPERQKSWKRALFTGTAHPLGSSRRIR